MEFEEQLAPNDSVDVCCDEFGLGKPRFVFSVPAHAFLPAFPSSYRVPSPDGSHCLVMLCPLYERQDLGIGTAAQLAETQARLDTVELPNGKRLNLRDAYPASGLYRVGTGEPTWKTNYLEGSSETVRVTHDGRYCVCFNSSYMDRECDEWAVAFLGPKGQIKTYSGKDLIDFPSLLSSSGWYCVWIADGSVDPLQLEIHDGKFTLHTAIRDRFVFDVTSGELVEESRFWRRMSWVAVVDVPIVMIVAGWLLRRAWLRHRLKSTQTPTTASPDDARRARASLSLRELFFLSGYTAVFCWLTTIGPPVAILAAGLTLSILLVHRLAQVLVNENWKAHRARNYVLAIVASLCCFTTYVLTAPPVSQALVELDVPYDVRIVVGHTCYAPILWAAQFDGGGWFLPHVFDMFEEYANQWEDLVSDWT